MSAVTPLWNRMSRFAVQAGVGVAGALLLFFPGGIAQAGAADVALPPAMQRALEANVAALSPLTVQWERTRQSGMSAQEWKRVVKTQRPQAEILAPQQVTMMLQDNMFYFYRLEYYVALDLVTYLPRDDRPLRDRTVERAFDGRLIFLGTGRKPPHADPSLAIDEIETLRKVDPDYQYMEPEYFYEAGFKLPGFVREFGPPPQSLILFLLAQGGKVVRVHEAPSGNRALVAVSIARENRLHTFSLDRALGYAVRERVDALDTGKVLRRSTCNDFQQIGQRQVLLPKRCEVTSYSGADFWQPDAVFDVPILVNTYRITKLVPSPIRTNVFTLSYDAPGTLIADGRLPGSWHKGRERVSYIIPADRALLDEAIERAIRGKDYVPRGRWGRWGSAFLIFNVVLAVLALVYWFRRRHRTA